MNEVKIYYPSSKLANENGYVIYVPAIVRGHYIHVPKKQAWCYRYEIATYEAAAVNVFYDKNGHAWTTPKEPIGSQLTEGFVRSDI